MQTGQSVLQYIWQCMCMYHFSLYVSKKIAIAEKFINLSDILCMLEMSFI